MNLNISNHFYTVYLSIRKALLRNDIIIFVQSLAEAMFLTDLELNTVSLFTSLMSFSVSCCMTFPPIRFMLIFVILQVDFVPNLDNSQKEPSLLPARISSLLLNDSSGIAVWVCIHFIQVLLSQIFIYAKMGFLQLFKLLQVGMARNIPHNLGELVDALSVIIQNPEATVSNLYHISLWVQYYVRLFVCMYVEKALSCYFSCDNC